VSVIIAAAGAGRRFGGERNKIFELIGGRCVFLRSIDLFAGRDDVCEILLVASADDREHIAQAFAEDLARLGVRLVTGGETRSESVRNALAAVSDEATLVCVHGAVRPGVSAESIDEVIAAVERTGAAILAWPISGAVRRVSADNVIAEPLDRDDLWQAQTPQVFARDVINRAYALGADADDDAELVRATGQDVHVIRGGPGNIKITTADDLAVLRAVMESQQ
ncbi:MAG: 2-C-methyl-D-erythritol 4-phosphate cytidylyltransferase, partial [Phycisphaerae bacterium]|nr:2-C-methyl-D-erythritol 4-phosphate cytidylyltransferase [Phycisphaerae bacterium]